MLMALRFEPSRFFLKERKAINIYVFCILTLYMSVYTYSMMVIDTTLWIKDFL